MAEQLRVHEVGGATLLNAEPLLEASISITAMHAQAPRFLGADVCTRYSLTHAGKSFCSGVALCPSWKLRTGWQRGCG